MSVFVCLSFCLWRLCIVVTECNGSRISLHAWINGCLCYLLTTPHPDRRMGWCRDFWCKRGRVISRYPSHCEALLLYMVGQSLCYRKDSSWIKLQLLAFDVPVGAAGYMRCSSSQRGDATTAAAIIIQMHLQQQQQQQYWQRVTSVVSLIYTKKTVASRLVADMEAYFVKTIACLLFASSLTGRLVIH